MCLQLMYFALCGFGHFTVGYHSLEPLKMLPLVAEV